MTKDAHIEHKKITDLKPDPANANAGTERGLRALDDSLAEVGLGRSVLVDKNGYLIAGNKTVERSVDRGFEDAIVVHTRGDKLVVVQRDDLDLTSADDFKARKLAYYDNRVGQLDLEWSADRLLADANAGIDLGNLWHDWELEQLIGATDEPNDPTAEWSGMPEYAHDDLTDEAAFTIRVFLKDADDLAAFGQLLGKDLTGKKFVWFSKQPIGDLYEVHDEAES